MTEKTFIKTVWVIAQSEAMAWQLLKRSTEEHVYTDRAKALSDFQIVQKKTFFDTFDGQCSQGKPWRLFTLTFSVTFVEEGI